jgi:pimeloyl-ACP methyl ester carboxylesterase
VLKQVRLYFKDPKIRASARAAVDKAVDADARVLVAHSLGSVVACEALHQYSATPRWANIRTLVTLGSPLGIPNLIFEALDPTPNGGRGAWPGQIQRWTNVSDDGDVVALTKKLGPLFGGSLVDVRIVNGANAHDVMPYLTARETGEAIADGLR